MDNLGIILGGAAAAAVCLILIIMITCVAIHSHKKNKVKRQANTDDEGNVKPRAQVYRVSFNRKDHTWVIKRDRAGRIIDSFFTKEEALARVNELSKNQDVGFTVKKKNGRFQKKR